MLRQAATLHEQDVAGLVTDVGWIRRFTAALGQFGLDSGVYGLMNTHWGWPIAECVHFIGLCLLFGTIGLFDLRMMGVVRGLSLRSLHRLVPYGVAGYGLCLLSGLMFVLAAPFEYIENPAWDLKMGLMAVAGLNMVVFYRTTAREVYALGADARAPLAARIIAIVSLASWIGIMSCGRIITAFRPYIQ
jgi:hypothetical protein